MLQIQPFNGTKRTLMLKGNGSLQTNSLASAQPKVFIPEIVRMSEFYGPDVKPHFEKCPSVIEIPLSNPGRRCQNVRVKDRWTFGGVDTGSK